MQGKLKLRFLWITVIFFALINSIKLPVPIGNQGTWLNGSNEAYAKSSGGRSGGGSFSRSSSPSRSNSTPSRSNSSSSSSSSSSSVHTHTTYGYSSASTSSSSSGFGIVLLLLLIGCIVFVVYVVLASRNTDSSTEELDNDIVTVSKLQVALLAQARTIQSQLSELSLSADTETPEGLAHLLQESALALLRSPEYWTHVLSSSQTVKSREEAQTVFNKLSIEERSKFSAETLTHVGGRIGRQAPVKPGSDEDIAAYIVVTLLVGTENDQPLFEKIHSTEELKEALERIAATSTEYLLTFELLWSPEHESDSLTYDELLTEYTDMIQI